MSLADGLSMEGDGPSSMGVVVVEAEAVGRVAAVDTEGGGGAHCIGESWQQGTWWCPAIISAAGCRNGRDQQQE
jgi:hypothetical protein